MADTLESVRNIAARLSGIPPAKLNAASAVAQDMRISGDDVTEFAQALEAVFGGQVLQWPWQRFAELSEPHLLTGFWFIWRLLTWPVRGRLFDPSPFERLELGHIAKVIDAGHWIEP